MGKLHIIYLAAFIIFIHSSELLAFSRPEDHVVLKGKIFSKLHNKPIDNIRIYTYKNRSLKQIPFQIDKLDFDGNYLFNIDDEIEKKKEREEEYQEALEDEKYPSEKLKELKARANWIEKMDIFDVHDELVFMAWDIGDKLDRDIPGADIIEEIKILNPTDSSVGYAYAVIFKNEPPPLSPVKYIEYLPEKDEVHADYYILKFHKDRPHEYTDAIPRNADGRLRANQLDMSQTLVKMDIKFFLTLNFDESNINGKILAYKIGPVRVIKQLHCWMQILFIRVTPKFTMDLVFYPNGMICPGLIECPFNPGTLLNKGSRITIAQDFASCMKGSKIYTAKSPEPLLIDGKMSEMEKSLDLTDQNWYVVNTDEIHSVFAQIAWDKKLNGIKNDIIYVDDETIITKNENTPGRHMVGFSADILQFPKGVYKMYLNVYLSREWKKGQEKRYLDFLANPLQASTGIIK